MHRNDLLRSLLQPGDVVLDTAGLRWPGDLVVESEPGERAATVRVVALGEAHDHDAIVAALSPSPAVTLVLASVPADALPVGALVDAFGAARHQVIATISLDDTDTPVALVLRHVADDAPALHPYQRWQDTPGQAPAQITGEAILRLANEHAVEGYVWRAVEARLRECERELRAGRADLARVEGELAATAAERDAIRAGGAGEADAIRRQLADTEARRAGLERRIERITTSRSYRLARKLASVKRGASRLVGIGKR